MPATPRFLTVKQRQAALGPCIPAPEKYIEPGPNGSGKVRYNIGDPVPIGEARALGWFESDGLPLHEPNPINASSRGRKIRAADREQQLKE